MSQDRIPFNGLSPEREAFNKKVNLNSLSPFRLLSMLSRFPAEEPEFKEVSTEETQSNPTNQLFSFQPVHKNYDAEFYAKYKSIPVINFRKDETKDTNVRKFWERKRRHKEMEDNGSFIAASDTNYSRLDFVPLRKDMEIDDEDDDDDDAKTWRTQDMLNEEEYNNVVLDNQKIMELKKKIDEEFVRETLISHNQAIQKQVPQTQETEILQLESLELQSPPPRKSQILLDQSLQDERMHDQVTKSEVIKNQSIENKGTQLRVEYQLPELESQGLAMTIHSPQVSDDNRIDISAMREKMDNFNERVDWDDNDGQGFSDNENEVVMEEEGLNDTSANQVSPEPELIGEEINVKLACHLRKPSPVTIFKNKLGYDVKSSVTKKTMEIASDEYFSQLVQEMKAFKNQSRAPNQSSFTDYDMISFMKRQQILGDKTTLEQLAHKYLPTDITDELCVAAQNQNVVYPALSTKIQEENDAYYF